ncbi:MAG: DNA polymerase I, partial [Deltaproteobacteria bacterium]|nr:DNA polymerase I [Deltaproteobacteria bacterium]
MNRKRLFLIDGSGYIHRAYHAIKGLRTSAGIPTNAVYGFVGMLRTLLDRHKPDRIAVVFDVSRISFRNGLYPAYKANRPPAPDDLVPQFGYIKEIVRALNIPCFEMENYEADDVIATIAEKARGRMMEVVIVSSDKDLYQLVGEGVVVFDPMKERFMGAAEIEEKTGVKPSQIVDFLAIMGDSSDNVPGVRGIGEKGAIELLGKFSSLDG